MNNKIIKNKKQLDTQLSDIEKSVLTEGDKLFSESEYFEEGSDTVAVIVFAEKDDSSFLKDTFFTTHMRGIVPSQIKEYAEITEVDGYINYMFIVDDSGYGVSLYEKNSE